MEPYKAVILQYFDLDGDGELSPTERARLTEYERIMKQGEIDVSVHGSEERKILAEMWLAHVLTENLKRQHERISASKT
jgi:hypothetical protein